VKRSSFIVAAVFALLVLASIFAPAPSTRTVEAKDKSNACKGLQNAYQNCSKNDLSGDRCTAVREQLIAHGCYGSSSSGSF
jgi:hypothetical protein